jgi:WD40 repeat protein
MSEEQADPAGPPAGSGVPWQDPAPPAGAPPWPGAPPWAHPAVPRPRRAGKIVLVVVLALVQVALLLLLPVLIIAIVWGMGGGDAPNWSYTPTPGGAPVSQLAFSPDGSLVAAIDVSASTDASRVTVSDAATGKVLTTVTDPDGVDAAAISPDDTTVAILDVGGTTYLRDITTGQLTAALPTPGTGAERGQTVAFRPDGKVLAVTDADSTVYLWNLATRQVTASLTYPGSGGLGGLTFSPDGKELAVFHSDGYIYLFDPATGSLAGRQAYLNGVLNAVAFSPDGAVLASCTGDGLSLWHIATGRKTTLQAPDGCDAVAFSPDGAVLATGDYLGVVYLRDAATGTTIKRLTVPGDGRILAVAFSHGGQGISAGYLAMDTASMGTRHWTLSPPA